jgi:sugar phosphate isomerase/epimerase
MKIGIQTRPWGPEMNREQLLAVLADIAAAGYDGFEIGAQHLQIDQPEILRELAANHGLEVVGIHVGGEIYDPESVKAALDNLGRIIAYARQVGASYIPFSGKMKENKTATELEYQAQNLNQIGRLCQQHGLKLCYHNHFWEIEQEGAELRHLCDHTDPALVSLCLDVGWVQRAGGSPVAVVEEFMERVGYFHLKDTTPEEWREIGYGTVDFGNLLKVIKDRYDGWLVVEQDETRRQPVESAQMSRTYLKEQFSL